MTNLQKEEYIEQQKKNTEEIAQLTRENFYNTQVGYLLIIIQIALVIGFSFVFFILK